MSSDVKTAFWVGLLLIVVGGCTLSWNHGRLNVNREKVKAHIAQVTQADRGCNECHLGVNFISLFNNPVIADNAALIGTMLGKAGIRKW